MIVGFFFPCLCQRLLYGFEDVVIHYMDNMNRSEDVVMDAKAHEIISEENGDGRGDQTSDQEREDTQGKEDESDCDTLDGSVSSQGETQTIKDDKVQRASRVPKKLPRKQSSESHPHTARTSVDQQEAKKLQFKMSEITPKKSPKNNKGALEATAKDLDNKFNNMKAPSKPSTESSEGGDKSTEEVKEIDVLDEAPNVVQRNGTDGEMDAEENGLGEDKVNVENKNEEMELRIERLEGELREIAALEISLYSVVPEHGSSAHKVHTPARRLSRLYIHACKHWTQDKRASLARNSVSGLVLIAKSCGSDVPRLTFWWSNTIVLREIISQAFANSHHSSFLGRVVESNGNGKRNEGKLSSLKWNGAGSKQVKKLGFMQFDNDWQETSTFTAALEKIESWIFSRIIESVWWQTLTPHMQSPVEELYMVKSLERPMGPVLGDQQQGSFSINLWKSAFLDAYQRLCPVRAAGHECGCLPVLARMVMEQCVSRLDVAMFNAILRESANEIPTDPVSDPIVDPKVLPIPAGDLSFGSGAQLKNSIGNWSRLLTDLFGMDADDILKEDQINGGDDGSKGPDAEPKSFRMLNALSDLLMLPKDMLIDSSIRKEVCPSLGLPLIKRILCNFTPDEFCPDPVPGVILEALNSESLLERRQSDKDLLSIFPCSAVPVVYCPPSQAEIAEKVADVAGQSQLGRNASIVQRRGYTSDEELDELEFPLTCIIDKMPPTPTAGNGKHEEAVCVGSGSVRYELLREVWSV